MWRTVESVERPINLGNKKKMKGAERNYRHH